MLIRPITSHDQPVLWDILYEVIYVEAGMEPPPCDIVQQPDLARYVSGFGLHAGDRGVIAEEDGRIQGAAWVRLMHGYGFVDAATPELTIAVFRSYQGQGIGTLLLTRLFHEIASDFAAVSLSVSASNPARRLYERLGFEQVALEHGTATMRKNLR